MTQIHDFVTEQYAELLHLAKASYRFIGYREIDPSERFVLWRHDCDFSLNRSLRLAHIEHEISVSSTYFLNPHCEFYNLLEKSQTKIVERILNLGHNIALHFDAAYYEIQTEEQLDELVTREGGWLTEWFGVEPTAFSFHNPTLLLLTCERDTYGGLVNCYSRTFKETIPYCSDSNGYWRFRRLRDVLESAQDPRLQVLTHPTWWQEKPMQPRARIFRSVYGRAKAAMGLYDALLEVNGRENLVGLTGNLKFLKDLDATRYQHYDYLWNSHMFQSLFIELYCLHERQINQICRVIFCKQWRVAASEVNSFFEDSTLAIDGWRLFQAVFGESWAQASSGSEDEHKKWVGVRKQLIHGRGHISGERLEEGCAYLCRIIDSLARWGQQQEAIRYDGIAHLGKIGIPTEEAADGDLGERLQEDEGDIPAFPNKAWNDFQKRIRLERNNVVTEVCM